MKLQFDKRHQGHRPDIALNDFVLLRKGLQRSDTRILGPSRVVKISVQQGVLKTIGYLNDRQLEFAATGDVLRYHPRRAEEKKTRGAYGRRQKRRHKSRGPGGRGKR